MEGLQDPGTDFICHCTRSCQPPGKKDTKDFPHTWNFHTENCYILGNFSGNYSNDKRFYVAENDRNIEECLLNWFWYQEIPCCLVTKSCLTLCEPMDSPTPAPPSMGFSRQGYWSGLQFPSQGDLPNPEIKPRSPAVAGGFSTIVLPGKSHQQMLLLLLLSRFSRVRLCATPWTTAYQASPSMGFSKQEHVTQSKKRVIGQMTYLTLHLLLLLVLLLPSLLLVPSSSFSSSN